MIAREGHIVIGAALLTALGFSYAGAVVPAAGAVAVSGVLAWLYAAPRRKIPASPRGVLSPVDGVVARVESYHNPWLERDVTRIDIRIRAPGITQLHSVTEGKIKDLWTRYGPLGEKQLRRSLDASPDCYALWVQTDEGDDVVVAVSSRWPVSRCRFDNAPGERVGQGNRLGFVYFASNVDILVPADSSPKVAPGDRVRAMESVLAEHGQNSSPEHPRGD